MGQKSGSKRFIVTIEFVNRHNLCIALGKAL